jgi:hypothetical protein
MLRVTGCVVNKAALMEEGRKWDIFTDTAFIRNTSQILIPDSGKAVVIIENSSLFVSTDTGRS